MKMDPTKRVPNNREPKPFVPLFPKFQRASVKMERAVPKTTDFKA
jgi:hypothetical protein